MKPILLKSQDSDSLQTLGRASLQIVHDLKNQINGLKLYATFLRKRSEKTDRPADELETIQKLIEGLDRAAAYLSTLVQYGRPVEIKKQPGIDLQKIMRSVIASFGHGPRATGALADSIVVDSDTLPLVGEFDAALLTEALKTISLGATKMFQRTASNEPLRIYLKREVTETTRSVLIEWPGMSLLDHDPFRSFAGSDEIRMSLAAKIVEAHGGAAEQQLGVLRVRLPLTT